MLTQLYRLVVGVVLAAVLVVPTVGPVSAQDDSGLPSYYMLNEYGQVVINPGALTPGEPITMPPPNGLPYFEITIPGTEITVCQGCMVYNTYTTPDGTTLVVPSGPTAVIMALTGQNPFNSEPINHNLSLPLIMAATTGVFEAMGIGPEAGSTLDARAAWLLNALQTRQDFAWDFYLNANYLMNFGELMNGAMFLSMGLFEFACHPVTGECPPQNTPPVAQCPGGICNPYERVCIALGHCTPITGPGGGPVGGTTGCMAREFSISIPQVQYFADKLQPNFPVVIGQDPEKRGVDVRVGAQVPVITVSYNKEVPETTSICRWQGAGSGAGGCGAGYSGPVDYGGGWQSWMGTDPDWGVSSTTVNRCARETRTFVDRITNLGFRLELDAESVAWITEGDLQARYPGASVYRGNFGLWPGMTPVANTASPDGSSVSMRFDRVQIQDPGHWRAILWGRTSGTPYTSPRQLQYNERAFWVDVFILALTK